MCRMGKFLLSKKLALHKWNFIGQAELLCFVKILSRYLDYLMDQEGNYVSGNKDFRITKSNYLTFIKKINFKKVGVVNKCPGCGASINVNATGICPYCGTTYNQEDKNWILSSIKSE